MDALRLSVRHPGTVTSFDWQISSEGNHWARTPRTVRTNLDIGLQSGGNLTEMADVFVIVRFDISQGDASGYEIATFANLDEARRAFDAGRASGAYVDQGSFWSGATAYELARRSVQGYFGLDDGAIIGPNGLLGAPTITSAEVGGTWSFDPARRVGWPDTLKTPSRD